MCPSDRNPPEDTWWIPFATIGIYLASAAISVLALYGIGSGLAWLVKTVLP